MYYIKFFYIGGIISTYGGNGATAPLPLDGPFTASAIHNPISLFLGSTGDLYIGETRRVRKIVAGSDWMTTFAGGKNKWEYMVSDIYCSLLACRYSVCCSD